MRNTCWHLGPVLNNCKEMMRDGARRSGTCKCRSVKRRSVRRRPEAISFMRSKTQHTRLRVRRSLLTHISPAPPASLCAMVPDFLDKNIGRTGAHVLALRGLCNIPKGCGP